MSSGMSSVVRLQERFKHHGWKRLGEGMYSSVWGKEGRTDCIKIGTCTTWEPFVMWATRHGYAGTFAPKVYEFHRRKGTDWRGEPRTFYTARMERLSETVAQSENGRAVLDDIRTIMDGACDWMANVKERRKRKQKYVRAVKRLHARYPGLIQFCLHARREGYSRDWHDGNWMMHQDRIVLIDPASDECDSNWTRWRAYGTSLVVQGVAA